MRQFPRPPVWPMPLNRLAMPWFWQETLCVAESDVNRLCCGNDRIRKLHTYVNELLSRVLMTIYLSTKYGKLFHSGAHGVEDFSARRFKRDRKSTRLNSS